MNEREYRNLLGEMAIDEQSFGKNYPRVATDLNNLATLLQDTNRLDEAEPLMRRAFEISENEPGVGPSEYPGGTCESGKT